MRSRCLRWSFVCACALGCASGERFASRSVRLVSPDVHNDETLAQSRAAANEGDYSRALAVLSPLIEDHPADPLSYVARVMSARLEISSNHLGEAEARVLASPPNFDHALDMQRDLVRALLAARRQEVREGLVLLRPLVGRMIDRAQSAEVACSVSALEAQNLDGGSASVGRALRALAEIESVADAGVVWWPTGLPCDRASDRAELFRTMLARNAEPDDLAAVIDALPEGSSLRRQVALRLREIAAARGEITRWEHWLGDLSYDEAAIVAVVQEHRPETVVVGVLAPISGPRSSIGIDIVREVQLALRDDRATRLVVRDEGGAIEDAAEAFEQLVNEHPTAIIGPSQEELARAVMVRIGLLREAGVTVPDVYLLAPHEGASEAPGVRLMGPPLADRAVALVAAVRQRSMRVVWGPSLQALAPGEMGSAAPSEFGEHLRTLLGHAGVATVRESADAALHLVIGPVNHESATALSLRATRAPSRWVFDARSALQGVPGVWVGLRAGPGFETHQRAYCLAAGEAPTELGMLAYDAASMLLNRARGTIYDAGRRTIAAQGGVVATVVPAGGTNALAATTPCPEAPHYDPVPVVDSVTAPLATTPPVR